MEDMARVGGIKITCRNGRKGQISAPVHGSTTIPLWAGHRAGHLASSRGVEAVAGHADGFVNGRVLAECLCELLKGISVGGFELLLQHVRDPDTDWELLFKIHVRIGE